jgi:hypothetical protein
MYSSSLFIVMDFLILLATFMILARNFVVTLNFRIFS